MQFVSEIAVVILAAGESKRFGSPKQLANWQGEPLLLSTIKKVLACDVVPYVALGGNSDEIINNKLISPYLQKIVKVEKWSEGLSRSISESVSALNAKQAQGVAFLLADQPLISMRFLNAFFAKVLEQPKQLLSTSYERTGGKLGVPAYFPSKYFSELQGLRGDQGAKLILEKNKAEFMFCDGSLIDIDEPEDLVRADTLFRY